jgi:3-methyl-2-oxobutanoate hydroxymethyltransferase
VGDSFGMFALGYDSLLPVTLEEMIHHSRAVKRGVKRGVVVADLTFGSYEDGPAQARASAVRLVKEAHVDAVKVEGSGPQMRETIQSLVDIGIPVMGHLGFTPQSTSKYGGFTLQGRGQAEMQRLVDDARAQEEAGAFALVLERIPAEAGRLVTEAVGIPTVGAGAGRHTDGQVLLLPWMLGLVDEGLPRWFRRPKWAKQYVDVRAQIVETLDDFRSEVRGGLFPSPDETYA